jgi:ATP synthase proteolipid subunit
MIWDWRSHHGHALHNSRDNHVGVAIIVIDDALSVSFSAFHSGYLGASGCMILASWGSAWGTWRAGLGVCQMGIDHPRGIIKNIVPIVMAGVLGIYGLIVSVIITQSISSPGGDASNTYSLYNGYTHVSIYFLRGTLIDGVPSSNKPHLFCLSQFSLLQGCVVACLVWLLVVLLV